MILGITKRGQLVLFIVAITIISHLGIVANPGFYSHDEWDKFDHVHARGLLDFIEAYGRVIPGTEFGFPVRPLGFIQQGISSIWMQTAPLISHFFDVLLHAMIAIVIFLALSAIGSGLGMPLAASLIFTVSPLATTATGWPAASFDQWYVLFVCLTCWIAYKCVASSITPLRALGLFASAGGAILSKETAVILPAAVVLTMSIAFMLKPKERAFPFASAALVLVLVTLPLAAYLAVRWPALQATLAGHSHAAYTPSLGSIRQNLVAYFVFPFLPSKSEMAAPLMASAIAVSLAAALHLLLIVGVWFYAGYRYAVIYILAYIMFIAPVLTLSQPAAHYIYGSAVPQAIALGFVLHRSWQKQHRAVWLAGAVGMLVMIAHMLMIQQRLYRDGVCQAAFFVSLDARLSAELSQQAQLVIISPERKSRPWVGQRALHDRVRFSGEQGHPLVLFEGDPKIAASTVPEPLRLTMDPLCRVR